MMVRARTMTLLHDQTITTWTFWKWGFFRVVRNAWVRHMDAKEDDCFYFYRYTSETAALQSTTLCGRPRRERGRSPRPHSHRPHINNLHPTGHCPRCEAPPHSSTTVPHSKSPLAPTQHNLQTTAHSQKKQGKATQSPAVSDDASRPGDAYAAPKEHVVALITKHQTPAPAEPDAPVSPVTSADQLP